MKIKIKRSTAERIKKHDINLAGADDVINRAIDTLEKKVARKPKENKKHDLRHARVLSAEINGETLERNDWRTALVHILILAGKSKSPQKIEKIFFIVPKIKQGVVQRMILGRRMDDVYNYIKEIDASIAPLRAPQYGEAIEKIAKLFEFTVDIQYRANPPGRGEGYIRVVG